ncbi:MAG: hypothetical protein II004_02210 [Erysipelotrichaceae bacterium]|nr:hypothetical protein [Erysipelotrichaceae bacterium]
MDIYIRSKEDLIEAIERCGIVPFFSNNIKGFSIEENVDPKAYFSDEPGVWEWKGPVIQELRCAYGKFFLNKACFISKEWFYDFANYRREGYDFDARVNDGLVGYNEQFLYELISSRHSMLSKTAKALGGYVKPKEKGRDAWEPRKGFDTSINRLMMRGYVLIIDFDYEVDKKGEFYGWGISRYSTPEEFFGKGFAKKCYKRSPEESYRRLFRQIKKLNPDADELQIRKFLG